VPANVATVGPPGGIVVLLIDESGVLPQEAISRAAGKIRVKGIFILALLGVFYL